MILIGDENIPFEDISFIVKKEDIDSTSPNSTVLFNYNLELMKYSKQNDISYGVIVSSIKDAIYANSLFAKYIICNKSLSKQLQEIATNYMFDSRVLAIIENEIEIEEIALKNIDGIIYSSTLN